MSRFSIEIKASAQRELDVLSDALFARLDAKILKLADNPRPAGCKKLKGQADVWRIRVGHYRLLYSINDAGKTLSILRVAHRREVYD